MAINKRLIKSNDGGAAVPTSFNTVLYTGNGSTQSITGVGFAPDLVWIKPRSFADNHVLADSVRGINKSLASNTNSAENSLGITLFDSDGFSLPQWGNVTSNGNDFVAWCFKAGGAAVTNTDGTLTSQVSANTEAGFSIVTGSVPTSGYTNTFGHGLNSTPKLIIYKPINIITPWPVFSDYGGVLLGNNNVLNLNETTAAFSDSLFVITNTTFKTGTTNASHNFIAYCFAEVAGFSKFGSYSGGSTGSGNVIDVGFKPLFLMVKRTDAAGDAWQMFDTVRGGGDTFDNYVQANNSAAEVSYNQREVNFTNNGFYWTFAESGSNISGGTYIYMAFANQF